MTTEDRLETMLQYEIAFEIIRTYKYTFAEGSLYWLLCRQMEKMLLDSIEEQSKVCQEDHTQC